MSTSNESTARRLPQTPSQLRLVRDESKPLRHVAESHQNELSFNVMPGRPVSETLTIKEYRVGERYIEATFDREYHSSMDKSPSHLIFLTALVHTQKLLYAALCEELGLEYDPEKSESIKIWPTRLDIELPRMVRKNRDIVQRLWITDLEQVSETEYRVSLFTKIESQIWFSIDCAVYRIR
ncbi:MAG: hypothetical protein RL885_04350 [Planctomycetota bacterium]